MDYEVKYLLDDSKVLKSFGELTDDVKKTFKMKNFEEIDLQFVETEAFEFMKAGWTNRLRYKKATKKFTLTFKRRYEVEGANLEEALKRAAADGFSPENKNYRAEVDWGYKKMTLSFSNRKEFNYKKLPDQENSIELIKEKAPGKWLQSTGTDLLEKSRIFGPVTSHKYIGKFEGEKIVIEIWPLKSSYFVEVSFKEKKYKNALKRRELLFQCLEEKGWVLHEESMKTQALLKEY